MILIIHGNDIESSRNYYFEEKNKLNNPIILNGDGLVFDLLFQTLENKSFFNEKISILIENFFSKNKSTNEEFKKIIEYLNSNKNADIIFWESDEVSKTSINLIKNSSTKNFSLPQNLFTFLDNIKPGNGKYLIESFSENLKKSEVEIIFFMIIRQFRVMLNLTSNDLPIDEVKRMAPWQLSKLKKQAGVFGKEKLIKLYSLLLGIDLNIKTGKSAINLKKSIDFFLSDL
jgi:hypothetical protein